MRWDEPVVADWNQETESGCDRKETEAESFSDDDYGVQEQYKPTLVAIEKAIRNLYKNEMTNRHFLLFALKCVVIDLGQEGLLIPNDIIFYLMDLAFIGTELQLLFSLKLNLFFIIVLI